MNRVTYCPQLIEIKASQRKLIQYALESQKIITFHAKVNGFVPLMVADVGKHTFT